LAFSSYLQQSRKQMMCQGRRKPFILPFTQQMSVVLQTVHLLCTMHGRAPYGKKGRPHESTSYSTVQVKAWMCILICRIRATYKFEITFQKQISSRISGGYLFLGVLLTKNMTPFSQKNTGYTLQNQAVIVK